MDEDDFKRKVGNGMKLVEKGDKVKGCMRFKGGGIRDKEMGEGVLEGLCEGWGEVGRVERKGKMEGRSMLVMVAGKVEK